MAVMQPAGLLRGTDDAPAFSDLPIPLPPIQNADASTKRSGGVLWLPCRTPLPELHEARAGVHSLIKAATPERERELSPVLLSLGRRANIRKAEI
jgi:hypothetical protein